MSRTVSEKDWKIFRQLHPIARERFCQQILGEIERVTGNTQRTSHERCQAVFQLIERRNDELRDLFNDLRRSTALFHLGRIQSYGLLTEEELSRFSPETREALQFLTGTWRP